MRMCRLPQWLAGTLVNKLSCSVANDTVRGLVLEWGSRLCRHLLQQALAGICGVVGKKNLCSSCPVLACILGMHGAATCCTLHVSNGLRAQGVNFFPSLCSGGSSSLLLT